MWMCFAFFVFVLLNIYKYFIKSYIIQALVTFTATRTAFCLPFLYRYNPLHRNIYSTTIGVHRTTVHMWKWFYGLVFLIVMKTNQPNCPPSPCPPFPPDKKRKKRKEKKRRRRRKKKQWRNKDRTAHVAKSRDSIPHLFIQHTLVILIYTILILISLLFLYYYSVYLCY